MKGNTKLHRSWSSAWSIYRTSRGRGFVKRGFWKLVFVTLGGLFLIFKPDHFFRSPKLEYDTSQRLDSHTAAPENSNGEEQIIRAEVNRDPEPSPTQQDDYDPQLWRHLHSYSFEPRVSLWDEKRARWLAVNPPLREGLKNVLMVTGSQPKPCERPIGTHLLIKAAKNKIDYCRLHDIPLYYNMAHPEPELSGWWVKLPVIRMLMLAHSEVEWIWWVDSDAMFTDMVFEPHFDAYDDSNLVLWGVDHMIYDLKDWKGLNTGDFFIRNCQWSLDLLDAWASMGPSALNKEAGTVLSKFLFDRGDWVADDQSAIVYLLATEKQRWASKVHFERNVIVSGDWTVFGPQFEELMLKYQPGSGDWRCPLVTHFAGCQPCSKWNKSDWDQCLTQMQRSLDFADHQVYQTYGFNISKLGSSDLIGAQTPLQIVDWDKKRKEWVKKYPTARRPAALLASGSQTQPCSSGPMASYIQLRAMKNKIDYSRLHDIPFFHNSLDLDHTLTGSGWDKIPVIRTLMSAHPEVEWIWWVDSDAIFTDLGMEIQFEKYEGKNLVLWGNEKLVFDIRSHSGLNTGDFLLRNCQWSLDLLDAWAAMGSMAIRQEAGKVLNKALTDRPAELEADDRSSLVYGLVTQRHKWASKVFFESSLIFGSGDWTSFAGKFEELTAAHHSDRPFVTHFAGCLLCEHKNVTHGDFPEEHCLKHMERVLDLADDQVLLLYGLQHRELGSPEVLKIVQRDIINLAD